METIDHKRTISSEQSHYSRRKRKLTLENNEIKSTEWINEYRKLEARDSAPKKSKPTTSIGLDK
jgi:hypothetical protein